MRIDRVGPHRAQGALLRRPLPRSPKLREGKWKCSSSNNDINNNIIIININNDDDNNVIVMVVVIIE